MSKYSKIFNKSLLTDLYKKQRINATQIALNYKVSYSIIYYWLKQYNIKRRTNSEAHKGLQIGDKNGRWIDGRKNKPNFCIDCGKKIVDYLAKRCKKHWKSWLTNSGIRKGKNNGGWQGGISKLPYAFEFTKELKDQIRKRDKNTCQLCHKKGYIIHHIDYNKKNCKEDNLITTCKKCNSKVNFDRDYWYAYFRYVIEQK